MTVPYAFGAATTAIPLSQLDSNFDTPITLGNTAIQLGNTVTTLNNMTLANVTISSGNVTITNVTVTTANATTVNTTTLIATTANVTTGNVTNLISGNVSLTGGNITSTAISGSTGSFTTLTTSNTVTINGGTANGVAYLDASKVLTTGSALTFDGTTFRNFSGAFEGVDNMTLTALVSGTNSTVLTLNSAGTNGTTRFQINNTEQMRLTSTSLYTASGINVGIGTSSPATKLHVNTGAAGYGITVAANSQTSITYQLGIDSNSNLAFYDTNAAAQRLVLSTSGNLGLGVTPSAATLTTLEVPNGGVISFKGSSANITSNAYYNAGWKYTTSSFASYFAAQGAGGWAWFTAASGTAGDAITFTQAMTLDASGNLQLGATSGSGNRLNVVGTGGIRVNEDGASTKVITIRSDFAGVDPSVMVTSNHALLLGTNNTERARITSGGYFKASNDGTYVGVADATHEFRQTANNNALVVSATNASYTSTVFRGIVSRAASTAFDFEYHTANAVLQWQVRGDGNAYNVNGTYGTISDAKMKTDIVDAGSQWADIKAVRFRKFKMKDDPSGLLQLGVVAQELEQTSPGLVDEHIDRDAEGNDLGTTTKSVKTSVLLMKAAVALQEAMARIEKLEAEVATLKGA